MWGHGESKLVDWSNGMDQSKKILLGEGPNLKVIKVETGEMGNCARKHNMIGH